MVLKFILKDISAVMQTPKNRSTYEKLIKQGKTNSLFFPFSGTKQGQSDDNCHNSSY